MFLFIAWWNKGFERDIVTIFQTHIYTAMIGEMKDFTYQCKNSRNMAV
jgi:hypothetical protein